MRRTTSLILAVLAMLAVAVVALAWWLQDANRLKPRIETLAGNAVGAPVTIGGDLSWRLWPPLLLNASRVATTVDGAPITVDGLHIDFDVWSLLGEADTWRIDALELAGVSYEMESARIHASTVTVRNFTPGTPSSFTATGTYAEDAPDGIALAVTAQAEVTYSPVDGSWQLEPLEATVNDFRASCRVWLTPTSVEPVQKVPDDALLPLDLLAALTGSGDCRLRGVVYEGARFDAIYTTFELSDNTLKTSARIDDFFGGRAAADLVVALDADPIVWQLTDQLDDVAGQRLLDWLEVDTSWSGSVTANGTATFTGNTERSLARSLNAEHQFDGGQGELDITELKRPVVELAALTGRGSKVTDWPDRLTYQRLTGTWVVREINHDLDVLLDNLRVDATGTYRDDTIDMLAELTVDDDPTFHTFDINPLLVGLPIPMRCRGPVAEPTCRLDKEGGQRLIAKALGGQAGKPLKQKLEQKITEEVPAELQDAARSLLERLGRVLDGGGR